MHASTHVHPSRLCLLRARDETDKRSRPSHHTDALCISLSARRSCRFCERRDGMESQCSMLEAHAAALCLLWPACAGVVCRADYGGHCLARGNMASSGRSAANMWGYDHRAPVLRHMHTVLHVKCVGLQVPRRLAKHTYCTSLTSLVLTISPPGTAKCLERTAAQTRCSRTRALAAGAH